MHASESTGMVLLRIPGVGVGEMGKEHQNGVGQILSQRKKT
jgi:hypothetical protein